MHKNNFDFLRLLFAIFVIITHSYILSGIKECDILCQITPDHINLSYLGVRGFFIISGYLIFQSLIRSKSLKDYYWKRLLRLMPGLFVVLLLTVLLAQFVYHNPKPYWTNRHVLMYLPNNLTLFKTQMSFEGVFENNPIQIINGSLWTLTYEFSFYIIISLLYFIRRSTLKTAIVLSGVYLFFYVIALFFSEIASRYGVHAMDGNNFTNLGSFFIAGSLLALFKIDRYKNESNFFLYVSLFLLILTVVFNKFNTFQFILLPLTIIIGGLKATPYLRNVNKFLGDLSYGLYIYSFVIQQTLVYFFKLDQTKLLLYSLPLSIFFAYLSWHLVEKRALKLKGLFSKKTIEPDFVII